MASIMTSIELQDRFSTVVYSMINAANLSISAMYDMREAVEADIDTAALAGAKDQLDDATLAARQLQEAMREAGQAGRDIGSQQVSKGYIPVEPVFKERNLPSEPVQIPVEWKMDDFPVFTGTGIERFTQEIQNADQMLSQLCDTQQAIVQQAENMTIFSPEAQMDLNQMASRIEAIRSQIVRMEQKPVNIGTNAANAGMERLRGQLSGALREQQALNRAVESMDVESANAAYQRLSETVADTERYIRDNVDAQEQFNQSMEQGQVHANNLMQAVKRIAATYISIQGLMKVIDISDQLASTKAKLDMMNDGMRTTKELQDMIFVAAERSRGSYLNMTNSVAKLGNLAKDAFNSTEEVVAFSEQLNKQFILAGASTSEIQNSTLQLTQALASGVLRGDELNSIFEQAPTIIQSIADYMGVPIGQIRELASEGQITADIVKNAMFAAADETNARFESMPKTFEQIGQSIQNQAIMAFEPVFTRLNQIANSSEFEKFVNGLCQSFSFLASIVVEALNLVIMLGGMAADAWFVIGPAIMAAVTALLLYNAALKVYNTIQKISNLLKAVAEIREKAHAAALMMERNATFMATAAQYGFNAALLACPITWVILLIVALIAVILGVILAMNKFGDESTTAIQKVCGAFAVAGAFIGNLFISLINFIIDDFAMLWNYIALFANFLANVFTDPIGAIARLFFGLIDLILAGIEGLASALDMLFGSNLAEAVAGWRTNLDGWVTDKFGEGKVVMEKVEARDHYIQGFDYEEAWNKGTEFGGKFGGSSSISGMGQYDDFDYSSYLTDISDNTEDIKEGLEVSEEDLKFMRDIAEQEAVNRFTTASITIEQTNHNNVSGSMDLDGMITGLTDAVSEAADVLTEGVHE